MASKKKNLSDISDIPSGEGKKIGIVVSDWNSAITENLLEGCKDALLNAGVREEDMKIVHVPGSFELPLAARLLQQGYKLDAIICLGCLIKGETKHDEYIAQAVASATMQLSVVSSTPVIFGVLTTNDYTQAEERAGGKHGNKGTEAAVTALKMAAVKAGLKGENKKIGFSL